MTNKPVFEFVDRLPGGSLHLYSDPKTELRAIVAIHNTRRGPALGGCRCLSYASETDALNDAVRLANGMTHKAAVLGLPMGGGKSVLLKPPVIADREAYFASFGRFIDTLGGQYITAIDSGTAPEDMDIVAKHTRHVTCTSSLEGFEITDPSPYTAKGVILGMLAALQFKLGRDSLEGIHVAVQGVGNVGALLVEALAKLKAKITICEADAERLDKCRKAFPVDVVPPKAIYQTDCDIFAPSALGAILNEKTIPQLKAKIIAGSANNQLEKASDADLLMQKGILYAPDYVVNGGGLINAVAQYHRWNEAEVSKRVQEIPKILTEIFTKAKTQKCNTEKIAAAMAKAQLERS